MTFHYILCSATILFIALAIWQTIVSVNKVSSDQDNMETSTVQYLALLSWMTAIIFFVLLVQSYLTRPVSRRYPPAA